MLVESIVNVIIYQDIDRVNCACYWFARVCMCMMVVLVFMCTHCERWIQLQRWSSWLWRGFNTAEVPSSILGLCNVSLLITRAPHAQQRRTTSSQMVFFTNGKEEVEPWKIHQRRKLHCCGVPGCYFTKRSTVYPAWRCLRGLVGPNGGELHLFITLTEIISFGV